MGGKPQWSAKIALNIPKFLNRFQNFPKFFEIFSHSVLKISETSNYLKKYLDISKVVAKPRPGKISHVILDVVQLHHILLGYRRKKKVEH